MPQQKKKPQRVRGLDVWTLRRIKKKNPHQYKRIIFNMLFLRKMKKKYKKLHCVYCNKEVIVFYLGQIIKKDVQATADHFLPRSQYPELEFDYSNLRVCCDKCNTKKGANIWEEKYPYPENLTNN